MSHQKPDLENIFTYHSPKGDQPARYQAVREGALAFAKILDANVPDGADKSAALRELRVAVMTANAAIALEGKL
jgi:hypothetical protein